MSKSAVFPFRNGRKEVSVGDTVAVTAFNLRSANGPVYEAKVIRIGSSYLTISVRGAEYRYELGSGREVTTACPHYIIYSSNEGHNEYPYQTAVVDEVRRRVLDCLDKLDYDQATILIEALQLRIDTKKK